MAAWLSPQESEPIGDPILDSNDGHNSLQGMVLKRHMRYGNLCPCLPPVWNQRFLVIRGKYLFRYVNESSNTIKGSPIPIGEVTFHAIDEVHDEEGEIIPYSFAVSSIRKAHYFSVSTQEERDRWLAELEKQKDKIIKQKLGHAPVESWEKTANRIGDELFGQRVKREATEYKELQNQQAAIY